MGTIIWSICCLLALIATSVFWGLFLKREDFQANQTSNKVGLQFTLLTILWVAEMVTCLHNWQTMCVMFEPNNGVNVTVGMLIFFTPIAICMIIGWYKQSKDDDQQAQTTT